MSARILVAEPGGPFGERILEATTQAGALALAESDLEAAFDRIQAELPDVLVVGPSLIDDVAFELSDHLSALGRTSVVFVAQDVSTELMRQAMRAGACDVVAITDSIEEMAAAIRHALSDAERSRAGSPSSEVALKPRGHVVTIFSTKGGVGKTVLSTNLAVALAKGTGKRVALVDLDLEFGDVGIMLGIRPEHTIYDALQVFDRLDAEMLGGFMEQHSSGIATLLAPVRPEDAEGISAGRIGQVLDLARDSFDFVVVDTCPAFSETVLAALDRSDQIMVVTMMDVASIKNTRISMQKLKQLGYDNGRVQLVLNRSDSKVLLQPAEVEEAVGGPIGLHIPSDRIVPRSVNKGVPVVIEVPKSEVAKSITSLAKSVAEAAEPKEAKDVA